MHDTTRTFLVANLAAWRLATDDGIARSFHASNFPAKYITSALVWRHTLAQTRHNSHSGNRKLKRVLYCNRSQEGPSNPSLLQTRNCNCKYIRGNIHSIPLLFLHQAGSLCPNVGQQSVGIVCSCRDIIQRSSQH